MPGDSEHPVTVLADLYVIGEPEGYLYRNQGWDYRPATVADLVSALRAEGAIVIERTNGTWPTWLTEVISEWQLTVDMFMVDFEDAYTEAQPFPPAGGVS